MKHVLSRTAFAVALTIASPVWAQTIPYTVQYAQPPRYPPMPHAHRKHHKPYARYIAPPVYARRSHLPPIYVPDTIKRF